MGPDSAKSLHPARLSKMARRPRPALSRARLRYPSVPAAELLARMRMPRPPLPETLADVELRPEPGPNLAAVIDLDEVRRLRAGDPPRRGTRSSPS